MVNLSMSENKKYRIGLGVTGGIAAYKAIEVLRLLQKNNCEVRVAMSKHAIEFIQPLTFRALTENYVLVDDYAPENPDPIAHINFSQNVDLLEKMGAKIVRKQSFVAKHPFRVTISTDLAEQAKTVYQESLNDD